MSIKLNDLLKLDNLENVKIRFNLADRNQDPDAPLNDPLKTYQRSREDIIAKNFYNSAKRKWFNEGEIVIGLFPLGDDDKWLVFDISKITLDKNQLCLPNSSPNDFYEHKSLEKYEGFFGRLIVKVHKNWQVPVRIGSEIMDLLEVSEILPKDFNLFDTFPGYNNVNLSFEELGQALKQESWKTALKNQKGVYLITDTLTNKRYVGSAYGSDMLFGRWSSYAENGHGGNVELVKLISERGMDYVKSNFRYTILENHSSLTPDDSIIGRESFWKEIFLTRNPDFGYNSN